MKNSTWQSAPRFLLAALCALLLVFSLGALAAGQEFEPLLPDEDGTTRFYSDSFNVMDLLIQPMSQTLNGNVLTVKVDPGTSTFVDVADLTPPNTMTWSTSTANRQMQIDATFSQRFVDKERSITVTIP